MHILREVCFKSISNVLSGFYRCFVWLVPNDHKWPYCVTRVYCKTDYLGLFPEHGLCLGLNLWCVCVLSFFSHLCTWCVLYYCILFHWFYFDSASGRTINIDWFLLVFNCSLGLLGDWRSLSTELVTALRLNTYWHAEFRRGLKLQVLNAVFIVCQGVPVNTRQSSNAYKSWLLPLVRKTLLCIHHC